MEQTNTQFIDHLRHQIRSDALSPSEMRHFFGQFTDYQPDGSIQKHMGYDTLDVIVNHLIRLDQQPKTTLPHQKEQVHYEPTPARAILDLVDQVDFSRNDCFYDLGAGLGSVAILVHLLGAVPVVGIEVEPAYCQHAKACITALGITNITFVQMDARQADYTNGTVFFMFTPFTGQLLEAVLACLEAEAKQRPITICTYGTCTLDVARQPWLQITHTAAKHPYTLAVFESQ
ncbi:MAG: class I SAM-dependent methyltransferase [Chloroflexota bacterium]